VTLRRRILRLERDAVPLRRRPEWNAEEEVDPEEVLSYLTPAEQQLLLELDNAVRERLGYIPDNLEALTEEERGQFISLIMAAYRRWEQASGFRPGSGMAYGRFSKPKTTGNHFLQNRFPTG